MLYSSRKRYYLTAINGNKSQCLKESSVLEAGSGPSTWGSYRDLCRGWTVAAWTKRAAAQAAARGGFSGRGDVGARRLIENP